MDQIIGLNVIAKENLHFVLSGGIEVPKGTKGVIKKVFEGGPEGHWLNVLWQVDDFEIIHSVNPSQIAPG